MTIADIFNLNVDDKVFFGSDRRSWGLVVKKTKEAVLIHCQMERTAAVTVGPEFTKMTITRDTSFANTYLADSITGYERGHTGEET